MGGFRYLLIGLLIYWIVKRLFRVSDAVRKDVQPKTSKQTKTSTKNDNHGGEYVDYEEVD